MDRDGALTYAYLSQKKAKIVLYKRHKNDKNFRRVQTIIKAPQFTYRFRTFRQSIKMTQRKYSSEIVDGYDKAPSRSMLRAVGFQDEDFKKSVVGIASTWSMVTPCNMHINRLAEEAQKGVQSSGCKPIIFNTITVSDGISMGTSGMRYSLVSREVIADSVETVAGAQGFDGLITIGGCDKNMPGCVMAMARLNRPSIFIYGGSIRPGAGRTDIVSVFEAVGKYSQKAIDDKELYEVEKTAIPGAGSCGGMYTANSMATAIEVLGLSLTNSSSQEAESIEKTSDCQRAGVAIKQLIEKDIKPSDILTREAFENAIVVTIACGGSTNVVLHLLAIAYSVGGKTRARRLYPYWKKYILVLVWISFGAFYSP